MALCLQIPAPHHEYGHVDLSSYWEVSPHLCLRLSTFLLSSTWNLAFSILWVQLECMSQETDPGRPSNGSNS